MICCTKRGLRFPLDTTQLYRLPATGHDNPLIDYFFASSDGTRLVDAMEDVPRFKAALQEVLTDFPSLPAAQMALEVLDLLTPPAPIAPRYPQVGDVGVTGTAKVFGGNGWFRFIDRVQQQVWAGVVQLDVTGNGYSTPPLNQPNNFRLLFSSLTPISNGQRVTVDIAQGTYAPLATNIQGA